MGRLNDWKIEQVIKDLKFLINYKEKGTGLFDEIQMMNQMIIILEDVLNGKTEELDKI